MTDRELKKEKEEILTLLYVKIDKVSSKTILKKIVEKVFLIITSAISITILF